MKSKALLIHEYIYAFVYYYAASFKPYPAGERLYTLCLWASWCFQWGWRNFKKSLAFRASFSAYLRLIQTLPTYQKCWTRQETTREQVFLQDFWHFYIRFQMETPMRTASILVFLAHSLPILSRNLNWEGKGKKKRRKNPHNPKSIKCLPQYFGTWWKVYHLRWVLILGSRRQCSRFYL